MALVVKVRRVSIPRETPNPDTEIVPKRSPTNRQTLFKRVRDMLREIDPHSGEQYLDVASRAYMEALKNGSFVHAKELFDREDGKVPMRLAGADGENLKFYQNMPTDGPEAP